MEGQREQKVTATIKKENGVYVTKFELEGFQGVECNSVAELEAMMGTVTKSEATAEAYEIPVPDPVNITAGTE